MTTEKFLENQELKIPHNRDRSGVAYPDWHCKQKMVEFAKLKVKEALVSAAINATLTWEDKIDKDSILNAFDINSIK